MKLYKFILSNLLPKKISKVYVVKYIFKNFKTIYTIALIKKQGKIEMHTNSSKGTADSNEKIITRSKTYKAAFCFLK